MRCSRPGQGSNYLLIWVNLPPRQFCCCFSLVIQRGASVLGYCHASHMSFLMKTRGNYNKQEEQLTALAHLFALARRFGCHLASKSVHGQIQTVAGKMLF